MDLLTQDPELVEDWEAVARYAIEKGRKAEFQKKLSDYIYKINSKYADELTAYVNEREGDFIKQELDAQFASAKRAQEKNGNLKNLPPEKRFAIALQKIKLEEERSRKSSN